ncbi:hypothetical protein MAE_24020 [Microcystis aeruginosa NIES-843]|uniref:Uncharacterized protein n=1 Tax=Microcystis aeruginosa (strain NIES-843 / IAM M-2473) TaxID=449447 RepID=B0JH72_MICAN|nr:hypothetical protein MAE_24020 [Microcystis aeruginosa NIES-843]
MLVGLGVRSRSSGVRILRVRSQESGDRRLFYLFSPHPTPHTPHPTPHFPTSPIPTPHTPHPTPHFPNSHTPHPTPHTPHPTPHFPTSHFPLPTSQFIIHNLTFDSPRQ